MKKFSELIQLLSARLSSEAKGAQEEDSSAQSGQYRSASSCPSDERPTNIFVDREASDAARKLWCSAGHF